MNKRRQYHDTACKIIGLFCRIASPLQGSFAKETYNVIDPTNQSHPILWVYHVARITKLWLYAHTFQEVCAKYHVFIWRNMMASFQWCVLCGHDMIQHVHTHTHTHARTHAHTHTYTHAHTHTHMIQHVSPCCIKLIERTPPPRGGFLFTMFPDQEPGGRGPPLKNHPQNWSSSSRFLSREHSK